MNTFSLALSQTLEGEGERMARGGGAEWLKVLECEVGSLSRPPNRILLPGLGTRDATSHH
jgi:hypothetical protein